MKKYKLKNARKDLPWRTSSDNKTRGGKCLIVAGSKGMYGSAVLCATAAARIGAGYVYLHSEKFPTVKHPDFLTADKIELSKYSAVAAGPGFTNRVKLKSILRKLGRFENVVLDAEALNLIGDKKLPSSWIVTPHEGELSRILGVSSSVIRKNRLKYVVVAQKKLGCVVLLKGYRTLVCDGDNIFEIQSGNPALAKAGTGDVLTGIIVGLLSQGLDSVTAACLGAFIHGKMADDWIKSRDVLSLMASDLLEMMPKTLRNIR